jgi:hypothetical protein
MAQTMSGPALGAPKACVVPARKASASATGASRGIAIFIGPDSTLANASVPAAHRRRDSIIGGWPCAGD